MHVTCFYFRKTNFMLQKQNLMLQTKPYALENLGQSLLQYVIHNCLQVFVCCFSPVYTHAICHCSVCSLALLLQYKQHVKLIFPKAIITKPQLHIKFRLYTNSQVCLISHRYRWVLWVYAYLQKLGRALVELSLKPCLKLEYY